MNEGRETKVEERMTGWKKEKREEEKNRYQEESKMNPELKKLTIEQQGCEMDIYSQNTEQKILKGPKFNAGENQKKVM